MQQQDVLEEQLLLTLSYLEAMSLEKIFLDLDKAFLEANPELTYEDLLQALKRLTMLRKIKLIKQNNEKVWIRVYPKRSIWSRIRSYF